MATMTTIVTNFVMLEAYKIAARAMCTNCATMNDPVRNGDEFVHVLTRHAGEDWVEYECYAGPIHALIEKLNEGEK